MRGPCVPASMLLCKTAGEREGAGTHSLQLLKPQELQHEWLRDSQAVMQIARHVQRPSLEFSLALGQRHHPRRGMYPFLQYAK